MADNVTFTAGSGSTAATDDIAGVHFPRVKLIFGADGVNSGDVSDANPFPIKVTDGTRTASVRDTGSSDSLNVAITDASGNQIVTFTPTQYAEGATAATITGTALMWEDTSDTLRAVSASKPLPITIISDPSSQTSAISGYLATIASAMHAEDSAHVSGDFGVFIHAVRNDNLGNTLAGTNSDYAPIAVHGNGSVYTYQMCSTQANDPCKLEDSSHTSGHAGHHVLAVRQDSISSLVDSDGDYASLKVNSVGRLWSTAVIEAGSAVIGKVDFNPSEAVWTYATKDAATCNNSFQSWVSAPSNHWRKLRVNNRTNTNIDISFDGGSSMAFNVLVNEVVDIDLHSLQLKESSAIHIRGSAGTGYVYFYGLTA
jgi:hypothetical protein